MSVVIGPSCLKASVIMLILSYSTETALSNKIARNVIFLSLKKQASKTIRTATLNSGSLGPLSERSFIFLRLMHLSDMIWRVVVDGEGAAVAGTVLVLPCPTAITTWNFQGRYVINSFCSWLSLKQSARFLSISLWSFPLRIH